jgi:hypothetical protein
MLEHMRPDRLQVKDEPEMITLAGLRGRGWTPAMAEEMLGEPDKLAVNRHHRSGPPVRLYVLKRVKHAEQSTQFATRQAIAAARKAASSRAAKERASSLLARIEKIEIEVIALPQDELLKQAIRSYNAHDAFSYDFRGASHDSDPAFLERIQVNYVRHKLTSYDRALYEACGQPGAYDARDLITEKVLRAIAATYPGLAAECRRQAKRKRQAAEVRRR